jgi:hypothetical protein
MFLQGYKRITKGSVKPKERFDKTGVNKMRWAALTSKEEIFETAKNDFCR